jgi:hypothetical protein
MVGERRGESGCDIRIVVGDRIVVVGLVGGRLGRPGGCALALHDAVDRRDDGGTGRLAEGAEVQFENRMVGDDVALGTGLDAPDGEHGELPRRDLARDDRLQPHDDRGGEHHRID